jgi:cell division protein FtsL
MAALPTRAEARATELDLGLRIMPAAERAGERPALRVVAPARRRTWGIVASVACGAVFAVMLGLTTFQARIAADQLQLDRLHGQVTDAQARYEQLRLEVARLESPTRVVAAAKGLGMVQPSQPMYLSPDAADVATATAATGDATSAPTDVEPAAGRSDWENMKSTVDGTP